MEETIVNFSNKKRIKLLFGGMALVIASLAFIYFMVNISKKIGVPTLCATVILALFGVFMMAVTVKNMVSKDQAGLILNSGGIIFKGTPAARKIGQISWTDIESLSVGTVYNDPLVFLKLSNPEKYTHAVSPKQAQQDIASRGVGVGSSELSIGFDELKNLIEQYYHKYR